MVSKQHPESSERPTERLEEIVSRKCMSDTNVGVISNSLEKVTLRMCTMYAPPVVGKDVEDTQDDDQERSRPLGFEANSDHDASGKTEKRDKDTTYAPLALEDEANEQEYEQDTAGEEEAGDM